MADGKQARVSRVVRCNCGIEIRSTDEKSSVSSVQTHAREAHELNLSAEQVRSMMEIDQ